MKIKKKMGGRSGRGGGVRVEVNGELKFLWKFKKNGGGGVVSGDQVGGCQGGCDGELKFFVKIKTRLGPMVL